MKLFISWSGDRSKAVAHLLRRWLPSVCPGVSPWTSDEDIESSERWHETISRELGQSNFGILCVTPENLNKPWLLFEAGALSKLEKSHVFPVLLDLDPSQLRDSPIGAFQARTLDQENVFRLVKSINRVQRESGQSLPDFEALHGVFHDLWPRFDSGIKSIHPAPQASSVPARSYGVVRWNDEDRIAEALDEAGNVTIFASRSHVQHSQLVRYLNRTTRTTPLSVTVFTRHDGTSIRRDILNDRLARWRQLRVPGRFIVLPPWHVVVRGMLLDTHSALFGLYTHASSETVGSEEDYVYARSDGPASEGSVLVSALQRCAQVLEANALQILDLGDSRLVA